MLDANFALIKPSMGSGLVLFDTCDIHLTKEKTADKFGKKLGDVVVLGQDVHFNGAFLEESAIPYLATSGMVKYINFVTFIIVSYRGTLTYMGVFGFGQKTPPSPDGWIDNCNVGFS